jgi:hypothetical protein
MKFFLNPAAKSPLAFLYSLPLSQYLQNLSPYRLYYSFKAGAKVEVFNISSKCFVNYF